MKICFREKERMEYYYLHIKLKIVNFKPFILFYVFCISINSAIFDRNKGKKKIMKQSSVSVKTLDRLKMRYGSIKSSTNE